MSDDWFDAYARGDFLPAPAKTAVMDGVADPLLIVSVAMTALTERGVPLTLEGGAVDCAVEAAGRLLRCLGVEALDAWTVTS